MKLVAVLVFGALGWGSATGIMVADIAGVGPSGPPASTGMPGAPGDTGRAGATGPAGSAGQNSNQVGPGGGTGARGATGAVGRKGQAYVPTTHTIFQRAQAGDYTGQVRSVGDGQMAVKYRYSCDSSSPFLSFSWHGSVGSDYENLWLSGTSGSATQYMHPDATSGYFEVGTQDSCSWSITVTQTW